MMVFTSSLAIKMIIALDRYVLFYLKGGRSISFMIENDKVFVKYSEIWNKIKKTLRIKFHSQPVYDEQSIKAKLK